MTQALLFPQDNLLFFSAVDSQQLTDQVQAWLAQYPWTQDTLVRQNCSIEHQAKCRLFVMADNMGLLQQRLEQALVSLQRGVRREGRIGKGVFYSSDSSLKQGGIAFVFPGQGCQYPGMGQSLAKRYPSVATWIQGLDEALLETVGEKVSSYYYQGKYAQEMHPKLFDLDVGACIVNTLSLAYHELMVQLGIQPDIYVGHSTGEFTALMASGRIKNALITPVFENLQTEFVSTFRKATQQFQVPEGTLYSVGMLDSDAIRACFPLSSSDIHIALDNCPNQKIVFCPSHLAKEFSQALQKVGGLVDTMPFTYAYHTPLFSPVRQALDVFYDGLMFNSAGRAKLYSSITAQPFPDNDVEIRALSSSLLEEQVRFQETIENLADVEHIKTFVEVGPRNNISAFVNDTLRDKNAQVVSTGQSNMDEVDAFLQMIGQLFVAGILHDVDKLYAPVKSDAQPSYNHEQTNTVPGKVTLAPSSLPISDQAAMLEVHFDLMQAFLQQQTRVMTLIQTLGKQTQEDVVQSLSTTTTKEDIGHVLLGDQVEKGARKASWFREVTLETEPYLLNHAFGGFPSLRDTTKTALPVIPFTFSMETTVEAAVALAGKSCVVQRIYDVRALSWFLYLGQPIKLDIQAQFLSETVILCRIFNVKDGEKKISFESKVQISKHQDLQLVSSKFVPTGDVTFSYNQGNFYITETPNKPWVPGMFHGDAFQAVDSIVHMGDDGVVATLTILSKSCLFANYDAPNFVIDPIMIDASLQVTAYWAHSKYGVDLTLLPFQVQSYQFVGEPVAEGSQIVVKVKKYFVQSDGSEVPKNASYRFFDVNGALIAEHFLSDQGGKKAPKDVAYHQLYPETLVMYSDVEYFDQQGSLFAKLEGWFDKHFSIPTIYNRFTEYPSHYFLSDMDEHSARVMPFEQSFLLSSGKVWLYKLAWLVLTTVEWETWLGMDEQEGFDYLYCSIVCKDLVRKHLLDLDEQRYAPVDLSCTCLDAKRSNKGQQPASWLCAIVSKPSSSPFKVDVTQHDTYYTAKFSEV